MSKSLFERLKEVFSKKSGKRNEVVRDRLNIEDVKEELREMGYDIRTVMVETTTRFGESCRYARYVLKGEPNEAGCKGG